MGKCMKCGKKWLFLRLYNGICQDCLNAQGKTKNDIEPSVRLSSNNSDKSKAEDYYNDIVRLYSSICTKITFSTDPIERLNDIPLINQKIDQCDYLLNYLEKYDTIPQLNSIFKKHLVYKDIFGKTHKFGSIKELSLYIWANDSDFLEKAIADLKNNITKYKRNFQTLKSKLHNFADFQKTLISLHKSEVTLSSVKIPKKEVSELSEVKFSSITAKSNYEKLGNFVVIDTETTGLSSSKNEIIEVAAIYFEDWTPKSKFETLIKPQKDISNEITSLTSITMDMVENAPSISEVIPSLLEYIGKNNIVGHNLYFDMKFLYHNGLDFLFQKHKYYDTLELAQKVLKKQKKKWDKESECYEFDYDSDYDVEDYKLTTLCEYYNIRDNSGAHRAASDCLATGLLFQNLVKEKVEIYS